MKKQICRKSFYFVLSACIAVALIFAQAPFLELMWSPNASAQVAAPNIKQVSEADLEKLQNAVGELSSRYRAVSNFQIEQGNSFFNEGNYEQGIESYQQALERIENKIQNSFPPEDDNRREFSFGFPPRIEYSSSPDREEFIHQEETELELEEELYSLGELHFKLAQFSKKLNYSRQEEQSSRTAERVLKDIIDRTAVFSYETRRGVNFEFGTFQCCRRTNAEAVLRTDTLGLELRTFNLLQKIYIYERRYTDALLASEGSRTIEIDKNIVYNISSFYRRDRGRLSEIAENLSRRLTSEDIARIIQVARDENATIVSYSLTDKPQSADSLSSNFSGDFTNTSTNELFIWVIEPTGAIHFRTADLNSSLNNPPFEIRESNSAQCDQLTVTPEECRGEQAAALAQLVRGTHSSLGLSTTSTSFQRQNNLQELYQLLISPIEDLLPINPDSHVVFVPYGSIFFIPFPALQDTSGQYLIDKHTIRIATNLRTLLLNHQNQEQETYRAGDDVLVVGNPTLSDNSALKILPNLEGAENEAKSIARLFEQKHFDIDLLLREQADEKSTVKHMEDAKIIHLATHGILDANADTLNSSPLGTNTESDSYDEVPLSLKAASGALALARSKKRDGLLTAPEILRTRLNSDLVVLSACNTGRGPITPGGVIGLPFSFSLVGVPNIVVSLWAVPDTPTSQLMTEFYTQLLNNPSNNADKAKALRQAMLSIKSIQQYEDPRNWAAFALMGGQK
ncbi:MAG: CHAT domain-containing protein [Cyanothece sp. SIO1E1]|nr:CHAT domain-containing protein [Cyanothece sp. SIO1E1]